MDPGSYRQLSPESISDEELMRRVVTRDQVALGQLYGRHCLLLRRVISQKLPNASDTDEVLQDVFIALWNCAGNYDLAQGKLLGWVICLARRRAIDHLRKNRRYNANHVSENGCIDQLDAVAHPLWLLQPPQNSLLAAQDLRHRLIDLIGELPVEQKRVLELTYFSGMSQRRIAALTGIPLGTIKTRLQLAINKLAKKSEHLREDLR